MSADPITIEGTTYPDSIDPMMAAIRDAIITAASAPVPADETLTEFGTDQVVIVPPDETEQGIDAKIKKAFGRTKGLVLLLVAGGAKNPDKTAPGPRLTLEMEAQLFVNTRMRAKDARPVLQVLCAVMKLLHHAQIRISGFPWYEELNVTGFEPMADPDFTAYAITIEREFQL